jgi:RNA polymerase sigma-70 factor (ECF subfamily)
MVAVLLRIHIENWGVGPSNGVGGSEPFEQLFQRWQPDVVGLCRRLLGHGGDAEDAAQDAFLRAWLARDDYSPVRPFWPWLATITRRLCIDRRRRLTRETGPVIVDLDGIEGTTELVLEAGADLRIVFQAIDELRPAERQALVLREVEGWSYQQIAAFEGVTIESVRGSLKRARASLRRSVRYDDVFDSV